MTQEHALIYFYTKEKKESLIELLHQYQFQFTFIGDEDASATIASLFAKETISFTNDDYHFNFILFKNTNHEQIIQFYKDAKKRNIDLSHKAVLTTHNAHWKLSDLLQEIDEEHTFFQKWDYLHALLKEANALDSNIFTEESYLPYRNAFIKGYMYTKTEIKKDSIDNMIQEIETAKTNLEKK